MTAPSDYQLGKQIANLLQQDARLDGQQGVPNSRLIRTLPDLLGSDSSLLVPLRDLLQRAELHWLLHQRHEQLLLMQGRDHLIAELQLTYSARIADRLRHTLNGILQLPDTPPQTPSPQGARNTGNPTVTYTVQASGAGQGQVTAAVIALLALISGGALTGLIWLLMQPSEPSRQLAGYSNQSSQAKAAQPLRSTIPATRRMPNTSASVNSWGRAKDYKFGQGPSTSFPSTCAFSETDARGAMTLANKSQLEFWACRDEGGDPENGYAVTWVDGKRTVYRFSQGGVGAVVGTNGQEVAIQWRNDRHNGTKIIVINHRDGAISWIPGSVGD